jgi:hypothetical protein
MGGALTLAIVDLVEKPFVACAPFYGIPPAELCDVGVVATKTPLQGHYGNVDPLKGFLCKASMDTLKNNSRL